MVINDTFPKTQRGTPLHNECLNVRMLECLNVGNN
jgi:hypothetical protein